MSVKKLTYTAICIALAFALSYLKLFRMPQGGSVTACSMLFIVLVAYWFGPKLGFAAGFAFGLLNLIVDPFVIHPLQLILDYLLAYAALGVAGFFRNQKFGLHIGYIVACLARLICVVVSGFVFFKDYATEGMSPVIYSLSYNSPYILAEMVLTLLLISIPVFLQQINKVKNQVDAGNF